MTHTPGTPGHPLPCEFLRHVAARPADSGVTITVGAQCLAVTPEEATILADRLTAAVTALRTTWVARSPTRWA
jgi:hypothetical protein